MATTHAPPNWRMMVPEMSLHESFLMVGQLKEAKVNLTYIDGTPFPKIRHRNLLNLIMGNSIQFSSVTQSCPILCDPVAWAVITYQ